MRRTHLRGHTNILKRLLIHASAFNLGLMMRQLIYGFTDLDGSQPDAWRYLTEVQDAGKPADVTGYR